MASQETGQQTVLDHYPPAVQQLFRGLENQLQRAGKLAGARQIFSCVEQRGGVPVMAAAVKAPFNRLAHGLPLRSCIGRASISARRPRRFLADAQRAHHSGARRRGEPRIPLAKQSGDLAAGLVLFKADLRLLVEPTTQSDKLRLVNLQCFSNGCVILLFLCCVCTTLSSYAGGSACRRAFCFILTKNQ